VQVLHIIRHGESEYNAATKMARDFRDPQIFDPKLTDKGRKEVHFRLPSVLSWEIIVAVLSFYTAEMVSGTKDHCPAQAMQLRERLKSRFTRLEGVLWVSSPLTRAIETFMLSCPLASKLPSSGSTQPSIKVSSF
jgi:broad specificity phosphatase PhoE